MFSRKTVKLLQSERIRLPAGIAASSANVTPTDISIEVTRPKPELEILTQWRKLSSAANTPADAKTTGAVVR